jgi:hypothetical protein
MRLIPTFIINASCRAFVISAAVALLSFVASRAQTSSLWDQPASSLSDQIAAILGPGQAKLTIRNLSTIPTDQIPVIRKQLEQNLKAHGVLTSGAESANAIRVTLSESAHDRVWVAEIVEGNETQVAMVHFPLNAPARSQAQEGMVLRKETIFAGSDPVLSASLIQNSFVALEPEQIVIYSRTENGWHEQKRVSLIQKRPLPRDPRGILIPNASGSGFEAWFAGARCTGTSTSGDWAVHCDSSDDPWPILQAGDANASATLSAFYNSARNYFTGVVTPSLGVNLPAFYSVAFIPRPVGGAALLIAGIDGKVQMLDTGTLKNVSGTRDWGSDFAVIRSGCGAGTQIMASGSGEAASDSLRAYEILSLEAVPASAALSMAGSVTALWSAPDGKSVIAVVQSPTNQYEVDRVTALCN